MKKHRIEIASLVIAIVITMAVAVFMGTQMDFTPATQADYDEVQQQVMEMIPSEKPNLPDEMINSISKDNMVEFSKSNDQCTVTVEYNLKDGSYNIIKTDKAEVGDGKLRLNVAITLLATFALSMVTLVVVISFTSWLIKKIYGRFVLFVLKSNNVEVEKIPETNQKTEQEK